MINKQASVSLPVNERQSPRTGRLGGNRGAAAMHAPERHIRAVTQRDDDKSMLSPCQAMEATNAGEWLWCYDVY